MAWKPAIWALKAEYLRPASALPLPRPSQGPLPGQKLQDVIEASATTLVANKEYQNDKSMV